MTILDARFASLAWASPAVGTAVEALNQAAIKFALGDLTPLDMEAEAQRLIQAVHENRIPCGDCHGWGQWHGMCCDKCSGRGWTWAKEPMVQP